MSEKYDELSFEEQTIPFSYQGEKYLLVEASGSTAKAYRDQLLKGAVMEDGGKVKMTDLTLLSGLEHLLVSRCCFKLVKDENGNEVREPVTENMVQTWPNRLLKKLYKDAKEISELDEKQIAEEGEDGIRPPQ